MARWLILFGIVFLVLGIAWPWIGRSALGRLPGDIFVQREGWSFYFPLTTSLIVSVVLSLLIWLMRR